MVCICTKPPPKLSGKVRSVGFQHLDIINQGGGKQPDDEALGDIVHGGLDETLIYRVSKDVGRLGRVS